MAEVKKIAKAKKRAKVKWPNKFLHASGTDDIWFLECHILVCPL